jgi:[acyl-carrier-protein] S-malonyltransferase
MSKLAVLFPGQGSQYVGMAKSLWDQYDIVKQTFEEADDVLDYSLSQLCFAGDAYELKQTYHTQPALLTAGVAAYKVYQQVIGVVPDFLAGHSLGEFTALVCAEVLTFSDALRLVRQRGMFMHETAGDNIGIMAVVTGIDKKRVEQAIAEWSLVQENQGHISIACYNSPEQTVISGHKESVQLLVQKLNSWGAQAIPLKVSAPFHSSYMKGAAEKLQLELERVNYAQPRIPVICNVTAKPYAGRREEIISTLTEQMTLPVRWQGSMEYLQEQGVATVIEMGPGSVLTQLTKQTFKQMTAYSVDRPEDMSIIFKIKETEASKISVADVITKCLAAAVCVKNHNLNAEEYIKGAILPYQQLEQLLRDAKEVKEEASSIEQIHHALKLLQTIFITKNVTAEEQKSRFESILRGRSNLNFLDTYFEKQIKELQTN